MDKQTWQNIVDGDKDAYAGIYVDYFKKFYNYGRKFTQDTLVIEDSIQEVFLDIWSKKEKMLHMGSPDGYFFSSFRYTLFKKIKQSRGIIPVNEFEEVPEFSVEYVLIDGETHLELLQHLQTALNALTPRQREAVFLRFYQGLSYEEIAGILNITVKATYKIMARSLLSLKEKMNAALFMLFLLRLVQG